MCRRAIHMVSDLEIKLLENEQRVTKSKYYVLTVEKIVDDNDLSAVDSSTAEASDERGIVQAFECLTAPSVHIHINDDSEDRSRTFWAILKGNERITAFERMPYQLKVLFNIIEGMARKCIFLLIPFFWRSYTV